jgi:hypothetical protein
MSSKSMDMVKVAALRHVVRGWKGGGYLVDWLCVAETHW